MGANENFKSDIKVSKEVCRDRPRKWIFAERDSIPIARLRSSGPPAGGARLASVRLFSCREDINLGVSGDKKRFPRVSEEWAGIYHSISYSQGERSTRLLSRIMEEVRNEFIGRSIMVAAD